MALVDSNVNSNSISQEDINYFFDFNNDFSTFNANELDNNLVNNHDENPQIKYDTLVFVSNL